MASERRTFDVDAYLGAKHPEALKAFRAFGWDDSPDPPQGDNVEPKAVVRAVDAARVRDRSTETVPVNASYL